MINKSLIRIVKVKEEYGWLSNMSPYPVIYNKKEYRTCEALFQALRFKNYPEIQEEIRAVKSPMHAKMIGRKNRELLERGKHWDESPEDLVLMKKCLILKLQQHRSLKESLLKTGNAEIIEDCTTHDRESARFWGMVYKNNKWSGDNNLGKLWMEIREEI